MASRGHVWLRIGIVAWALAILPQQALAQSYRVLRPEFVKRDYQPPVTTTPEPRSDLAESLDVAVLFLALILASYIVLKQRSRRAVFMLSLFSLLYFGFWRRGCVCSVGASQNMVQACVDPEYAIPWTVVAFFSLPVVFALFFGRIFCAAVCPLGAIQEVVLLRPVKVPVWLSRPLRLLPAIYLGLTVLFVVCGSGYLICRFDPFVGFFRFGASFPMLAYGAVVLAVGIFVGRPYCRFLCPYGIILGWSSRLARSHVTITPNECTQCRLCEEACPYGAILAPTPQKAEEPHMTSVRRFGRILALAPVVIAGAGLVGYWSGVPLSQTHNTVALAERVRLEALGMVKGQTLQSETFYLEQRPLKALYADALTVRRRFQKGGIVFGTFVGVVFASHLLSLSSVRRREDYIPDRQHCFSCARCFVACPRERERLRSKRGETGAPQAEHATHFEGGGT